MSLLHSIAIIILSIMGSVVHHEKKNVDTTQDTYSLYLPAVSLERKSIGVNVDSSSYEFASRWINHDQSYVRVMVDWNYVEPEHGVYDWNWVDEKVPSDRPVLLAVRNAPLWTKTSEYVCAPPDYDYWNDYAEIVNMAISRYPNVTAVEIWNEPNTSEEDSPSKDWIYNGCFGSDNAGAELYGEFFEYVFPRVKSTNPDVTIIIGSLLTNRGSYFFEWIDTAIAQVSDFDAVSYHFYVWYDASDKHLVFEFNEKLQEYNKPVWLTETSLLCFLDDCSVSESDQASYYSYIYNQSYKINGEIMWYELYANPWGDCAMVELTNTPKKVWYEYKK